MGMKPTPKQLAHCLTQLTRFIPTPPPPKVKLQQSKWGYKVGDVLVSPSDERFTIDQADSGGLTIGTPDGKCARIESREELLPYKKARVWLRGVVARCHKAVPVLSPRTQAETGLVTQCQNSYLCSWCWECEEHCGCEVRAGATP